MKDYSRIHICNFFGSQNKGDELMLRGAMALLSDGSDRSFTVSSFGNPERDADSIPNARFFRALRVRNNIVDTLWHSLFFLAIFFRSRMMSGFLLRIFGSEYRPLMHALGEADLVVVTGGPFLKENFRFGMPTGNLMVSLLEPFLAVMLGKPLLILGQAFSPRYSLAGRIFMRRIIDYAQVTVARDPASCAHANRLGAKKTVIARPDLAFLALKPTQEQRRLQIAVNVRLMDRSQLAALSEKWECAPNEVETLYIEQHAKGIRAILNMDSDIQVVFLNQAIGNDRIAAERIISFLDPDDQKRCTIQPDGTSAIELFREICRSQFAIVTRYHSSLLALCSGTPFVAFSYDRKVSELLKTCGHEDSLIFDLPSLPDRLVDAFKAPRTNEFDLAKVQGDILIIRNMI
jgi:polysaccharide pyruvyl transferase WcaK-like protein